MKKAVIFDVDGTLLNTEKIYVEAWLAAGEYMNIPITYEAVKRTRAIDRLGSIKIFRELCGDDFPYDDVYVHRRRIAEEIIAERPAEVIRMEHTLSVLNWLKERDVRMAAASTTEHSITLSHLEKAGIKDYLEVILGGGMVPPGRGKPNPDIFLLAAEKLGVKPEDCVVVGDTPADVNAGYAAGMTVILIPDQVPANDDTRAKSWKVLDDIGQLPAALEEVF